MQCNLLHCQRLVVSRDRRPIPSPSGSSYYLWAGLRVKPLRMIKKKATPWIQVINHWINHRRLHVKSPHFIEKKKIKTKGIDISRPNDKLKNGWSDFLVPCFMSILGTLPSVTFKGFEVHTSRLTRLVLGESWTLTLSCTIILDHPNSSSSTFLNASCMCHACRESTRK